MAVADAVEQAVGRALTDLSQRMAPDEVLVDLAHIERYTLGPRGLKVTLTMLVATNQRFWHLVHRDGGPPTSSPVPMEAVSLRKRTLTSSIDLEQSGHGWTVTGPKPLLDWVENIARDRPHAPVGLVAKVTPPSSEHPPSWFPDPAGRHELRYWDGTGWTEHVSDQGVTRQDPLG